jgi:sugar lactone lactonase YvrE
MKTLLPGVLAAAMAFATGGYSRTVAAPGTAAAMPWSAVHVATVSGFHVPECAWSDSDRGVVYVSNIESAPGEYWSDDGKGYISVMDNHHAVTSRRWIDSGPECVLHSPKGMVRLGPHLYFTDNSRLMRCTLTSKDVEVVASGFGRANDLCTDGRNVWLSDGQRSEIHCIAPDGKSRTIKTPDGINGITFSGDDMFGVSWDLHEVYELDPAGDKAPVPFGVSSHFTNLDGIEVLDDGTLIVSDFMGHKVSAIGPDRKTVWTLIETNSPADIGLNRAEGLIYVPHFMEDKVSVYRLRKN